MMVSVRVKSFILGFSAFMLVALPALAGEISTQTRKIGDFDGIEASGGYTI